jgi:hypothetical protein
MEDQNKPPQKNIQNKSIQTYASDMAESIEEGGGQMLKRMIHEEDVAEAEKKKYSPESLRNRSFTYAGVSLLAVGVAALVFIGFFQRQIKRVEVPPQFQPLIFTNKTEFVDITDLRKDLIASAVREKAATISMPATEVAGLYLAKDKEVVKFPDFISAIEGSFPATSYDYVDENFFVGVRGREGAAGLVTPGDLFFVIKVNSFVDIFPAMREWESKMFYDLGLFFQDGTNPLYTSTLDADFVDGWVLNKNARILPDDTGGLALMYVFVDDRNVVITASYDAAEEAILRLSAGELRK